MTMRSVGLLGLGHALPMQRRTNDDALFAHARTGAVVDGVSESDLFAGVQQRRVVTAAQGAEDLGLIAARAALRDAGVQAHQVDRLYGCVSPSRNALPNGLFEVHRSLGLPHSTWVVPIITEFTNLLVACATAKESIQAGACTYVLVVCAGAWTQNMDYAQPHAWSVGDGACAALLGPSERWVWLDQMISTHSEAVEDMTLRGRENQARHTFRIAEAGITSFMTLGMQKPADLLLGLMDKHRVAPEELTLVSAQSSSRLMDHWAARIKPAAYLTSIAELGNMTVATAGVNLSMQRDAVQTPYVGCIGLGLGAHFAASLVKR